ncbi:GntR family transcriptional regulator [Actinobacteria bacterium YIM 96077]|uniref:GntR family transcriptional regulator n=1 Tax=Phytoactinopolyspora halophila TaxID=1981511 RepID=A0A329QAC6_9ACTN|nr:GntR family transcriptional regulator [Phytoactinopolyspora halophila]AYY13708.1 GntR family transcriptional regulator [Actinobacteria bacterium YIM 96077]RAW09360.1 GntR family transcriptional regulator [Phytoactinopolyspora halophila]
MTLERTVMRERIKELVIERILDGTYKPGERVVELQLVNELNVSQAPVREALRDLEAMRFIESQPYRGARVRAVTAEELGETYPVRAALEELAGQLAAVKVDENLIAKLESEIDGMRTAARAQDQHELLVHDARFHELIVEAAENSVLLEAWSGLRIEVFTLVSMVKAHLDLVAIPDSHLPILDALREGDPTLVGKELRTHIESFGALVTGADT